jgi:hypothetical protein
MIPLPVTPGRATVYEETGKQMPGPFLHIELEINISCDLDCFSCDRFSDVTAAPNMTVAQVRRFVDESLELGWEWQRIRLLGGEPTLHPQLHEIVEELIRYRMRFPKVFLQLLSNGRGKLKQHREWLVYRGVDPHVEGKEPGKTPDWFNNTRIVPLDRDPNCGPLPPCGIFGVHGCGIGLTRNGYFLDGAGAAVARVAGIDCGVMRLKDLTWQAMLDQAKLLCNKCGHHNPDSHLVTKKVSETGEITGPFWSEALRKYQEKRPTLRVYGE